MNAKTSGLTAALLLAALIVSGCGGAAGEAAAEAPAENARETAAEAITEAETEARIPLPEYDFEGADIWILGECAEWSHFYESDLTGDVVDDAVYMRNSRVAEHYDINLKYDLKSDSWHWSTELRQMLLAGDGKYDIVTGVCCYVIPLALNGHYLNLNNFSQLSLDQPWYSQHLNAGIEIAGKMMGVAGSYDIPSLTRVQCTYFSSNLAEAFGITDLYRLVYDGKWTFEKMISIAEQIPADLDGDGVWGDEDRYGITSKYDTLDIAYGGTGFQFIKTEKDGTLSLNPYDERLINANEMLYNLQNNSNTLYYSGYKKGGEHNYDNMIRMFAEDRALFLVETVTYTSDSRIREMGTYGLLPVPKFYDEQPEYGAFSSFFLTSIPVTAKDPDRSAAIIEALNIESYQTVYPAYFDIALSQKFVNDDDSRNMLDIIYKHLYCDTSYVYYEHFGTDFALSVGEQKDYASWYEKKLKQFQKKLDKIAAIFSEFD